ncbi:hypothetical protein D9M70_561540 [compost metagenome]
MADDPSSAATNIAAVARTTRRRIRMQVWRKFLKPRSSAPSGFGPVAVPDLRTASPMIGVSSTATSQDTMSAKPITRNSDRAYSPDELLAKPTGIKPAIVTSVPASIGNAVDV